jgi:hypothetical protein
MTPRLHIPIIAIIASLLLCAAADARVKPGLYTGKTSEGLAVKVRVKGERVRATVAVRVHCRFWAGDDPFGPPRISDYVGRVTSADAEDPVTLDRQSFEYSADYLTSGTGGTSAEESITGSFSGSKVAGSVDFEDGGTSSASGSSQSCGGGASFTARRVPGS